MGSQDRRVSFLASNRGWIFLACVFIFSMQAGLFAGHRGDTSGFTAASWLSDTPSLLSFTKSSKNDAIQHPIPKLIAEAEEKFRKLLVKQSKTLEAAVAEYKMRYKRNPPKGFDDWWDFAQQHNVKLVDEYDGLVEDLAPFWYLTGEELRLRALQVARLPSIDLVRIQNGVAVKFDIGNSWIDPERGHRSLGFRTLMKAFQDKLPDMDLPVNTKAEGRILIPWEHQTYPNLTQYSPDDFEALLHEFKPDWQGDGNVWEAWRRTCPPDSPARRLFSSRRGPDNENIKVFLGSATDKYDDLAFVEEPDINFDFCEHPWAHTNQGHFFSDWRTIPILYPVFSPAKAQGFSDIRIPSHYYQGQSARYTYGYDATSEEPKTVDDMEVPWEHKSDTIFWRGTTTGGGSSPPGFTPQYQRHRFLRMAHDGLDINHTITFADPPSSTNYVSTPVSSKSLNREIMDTAFTSSKGNYPGGEEALRAQHRFAEPVPLGRHWSHKYLIDLDGMSYSARFMSFLASDSGVIKATVYKEFFSDWIQPWLHYIPLSSSYQEIYNIHAFFSGATQPTLEAVNSTALQLAPHERRSVEGDHLLRRIARAGKQWKQTIGRNVDMEAYVYRLCLEYARLWADDRDSMSFML